MIKVVCEKCNGKLEVAANVPVSLMCQGCGSETVLLHFGRRVELRAKCAQCGEFFRIPARQPFRGVHSCGSKAMILEPVDRPLSSEKFVEVIDDEASRCLVSAIILCHNQLEYTKTCVSNLKKSTVQCEIILVDNASNDGTRTWVEKQVDIIYVRNKVNMYCGPGRNQGAAWAGGDFLFFVDNDQFVPKDCVERMLAMGSDVVGIELWDIIGVDCFPSPVKRPNNEVLRKTYVGGGGMLIKREAFEALNGYDERYAPAWYGDTDLCFRAKLAGFSVGFLSNAGVEHVGGQTVKQQKDFDVKDVAQDSRLLFSSIWGGYIASGKLPQGCKPMRGKLIKRRQPKILFLCDVEGWAWWYKARAIQHWLGDEFDIVVMAEKLGTSMPRNFDLYFTFAPRQLKFLGGIGRDRLVTGVTAHPGYHRWVEKKDSWDDEVAALHANSKMLYDMISKHHSKTYYLPNGVDSSIFEEQPWDDHDELVVGFVGRINDADEKGFTSYLTPAVEGLNEGAFRLLSNTSIFSNAVTLREMNSFYRQIDVYAVASIMDGTPNPMLEASACGRPVVANCIGNAPEFIEDGVNGFLVNRGVPRYQEKFKLLRENKKLLREMGSNARIAAEEWDWKHQSENYRHMFKELLV